MEEILMRDIRTIRTLFFALLLSLVPAASIAGVFVSVNVAPPVLPVYAQPVAPGDGYLWTPGYWGNTGAGYFWVPGAWVLAPQPGLLWTPGYWGFAGGLYGWHAGYWGPHVGFYGGVNYGFGYGGVGFVGGRWAGGHFMYNTAVMHVGPGIHNTYVDRTVIHNTTINRTSFNGPGGINARPSREEQAAAGERHFGATSQQASHERVAMNRPAGGGAFHPASAARPQNTGDRPQTQPRAQAQPRAEARPNNQPHPANAGGGREGGQGEHERR
jgi:WXXGXW repeat (2 copies)